MILNLRFFILNCKQDKEVYFSNFMKNYNVEVIIVEFFYYI